jgi:hypothetical protein
MYFSPGGGDGGSNIEKSKEEERSAAEELGANKEAEEEKTVGEKIKEALQDWSNKDQQDQDFDDTRP